MKNVVDNVAARAQTPFKNQPMTDFTKAENRQAQADALEQVKSQLGRNIPADYWREENTKSGYLRLGESFTAGSGDRLLLEGHCRTGQ